MFFFLCGIITSNYFIHMLQAQNYVLCECGEHLTSTLLAIFQYILFTKSAITHKASLELNIPFLMKLCVLE